MCIRATNAPAPIPAPTPPAPQQQPQQPPPQSQLPQPTYTGATPAASTVGGGINLVSSLRFSMLAVDCTCACCNHHLYPSLVCQSKLHYRQKNCKRNWK